MRGRRHAEPEVMEEVGHVLLVHGRRLCLEVGRTNSLLISRYFIDLLRSILKRFFELLGKVVLKITCCTSSLIPARPDA